ncbi:MAG TPA: hypothetical protein VFE98_09825 [Candidatus Bathyarchaeia archaeon]|nr:hypothetical protein [Candidatus Bathyarchaeia archaeon]
MKDTKLVSLPILSLLGYRIIFTLVLVSALLPIDVSLFQALNSLASPRSSLNLNPSQLLLHLRKPEPIHSQSSTQDTGTRKRIACKTAPCHNGKGTFYLSKGYILYPIQSSTKPIPGLDQQTQHISKEIEKR